jgi:hypothetical protein
MAPTDTRILTSISSEYASYLSSESKRRKVTKRAIIEDMFAVYIETQRAVSLKSAYAQMAEDEAYQQESRDMAEQYLTHG